MPSSTRSWPSGSSVERLLGAAQRVQRVARRPTAAAPASRAAVAVEQVALRAARPRARAPRPRAREVRVPPTSAKAWRTRSRAAGLPRARSRMPRSGRKTSFAAWAITRSRPGTAPARATRRQAARGRGCVGGAGASASAPAAPGAAAGGTARSRISAPASCPATSGRGPSTSRAEARHDLGEPVERVRVARAVLGVAVQRQVGQDDAEAIGQVLDGRLELLVRSSARVQQRDRRARCPPRGRRRACRRRWW